MLQGYPLENIGLGCKGFPETNALAYLHRT